ncbi:hypothetical protein [Streptomyces sp. SPB074]|uniref:hypothetical protein n=1 Tax=Streptomyces sp. (strain SPB074) TaxID=465543 RepID=UPI00017F11D9|nr:hypothetical protein [Streptomyces sp. SPB074]EDY42216.1 hypothetical protein SSBG_00392 [Streptomyces sp. SPB074]
MTSILPKQLSPLPVNVRPRLGESTVHYIQRLAHANHLKPTHLLNMLNGPLAARSAAAVDIGRLATLSARSTTTLLNTLADIGPPVLPVNTQSAIRLARLATQKSRRRSSNIVGQIKHDALRNKGSLRQIADAWGLPRWLIKKILSPTFPDMNPIVIGRTTHLSDEHHSLIAALYHQGATPGQAWRDLVDNHDTWITSAVVLRQFRAFGQERGDVIPSWRRRSTPLKLR